MSSLATHALLARPQWLPSQSAETISADELIRPAIAGVVADARFGSAVASRHAALGAALTGE